MRISVCILSVAAWLASLIALTAEAAAPDCQLTNALTREVQKVVILKRSEEPREQNAKVGDVIRGEDVVRTGVRGSLAELRFDNGGIIRLASETAFTFVTNNNLLKLEVGAALFTTRKDCTIGCDSCGLSIAMHSTGIVEAFTTKGKAGQTDRCATKCILLEGSAIVHKPGSTKTHTLHGGQMIIQYADASDLAEVQDFDMKRFLKESRILTGFKSALPVSTMAAIQRVVDQQQHDLWRGTLEPTGFTIGGRGPVRYVEPTVGKIGVEAPFDPDVAGAILKMFVEDCPECL